MAFNIRAAKRGYNIRGVKSVIIDGEMGGKEWEGQLDATTLPAKYDLVTATDSIHPTVYVMNDVNFLYVAFDEVSSNGFAAFNTYHVGAYTTERLDAPGVNYDGQPFWDALEDINADETFDDTVTRVIPSYKFESAIGTHTEFKVPLANLGLTAGDAIYMMFVFFENGTAFVYPSGAGSTTPLSTYKSLTLTG